MKATFQGMTVAHSDKTVEVDGIRYFPAASVDKKFLEPSEMTTFCPAKGRATYFHLHHADERTMNAVFVYPEANAAYQHIRGWYGFWVQPNAKPGDLAITE